MSILINTLYAILTWTAAIVIGLGSWLGWALVFMAVLQSWSVIVVAIRSKS